MPYWQITASALTVVVLTENLFSDWEFIYSFHLEFDTSRSTSTGLWYLVHDVFLGGF